MKRKREEIPRPPVPNPVGEDGTNSLSSLFPFFPVNTRLRNANLQSRAKELLNKKERKKASSPDVYTTDEIDENSSILNRTGLPDYDGVVYTLDAKLIGNIGRYFNHSCSPNIAVQNVFVDVR